MHPKNRGRQAGASKKRSLLPAGRWGALAPSLAPAVVPWTRLATSAGIFPGRALIRHRDPQTPPPTPKRQKIAPFVSKLVLKCPATTSAAATAFPTHPPH
jgi:hypothetical protein